MTDPGAPRPPVTETNVMSGVWVFGYGSLIWRPGIAFRERRIARVEGWKRRFWQGSHDHRGVPHAPGRVVTLVPDASESCEGMAYLVDASVAETTFEGLDHREKNGYERHDVRLEFRTGGAARRRRLHRPCRQPCLPRSGSGGRLWSSRSAARPVRAAPTSTTCGNWRRLLRAVGDRRSPRVRARTAGAGGGGVPADTRNRRTGRSHYLGRSPGDGCIKGGEGNDTLRRRTPASAHGCAGNARGVSRRERGARRDKPPGLPVGATCLRAGVRPPCGSRADARRAGDAGCAPRARWRTAPSSPSARRCRRSGTGGDCPRE